MGAKGSGDFHHGGRHGEVGGSEAAGTGMRIFFKDEQDLEAHGLKKLSPNEGFLPKAEASKEKHKIGKFTIEHSTDRAHLISSDGKKMWIQKKWLREDGTLTKGAQEKFNAQPTEELKKQIKEEQHKINGHTVKAWNPSDETGRLYFSDKSFIHVSTKEATPHGYYENHRYAKGERHHVSFVTASGGLAEENLKYASKSHLYMAGAHDKVMVKNGEKWEEHTGHE